MDTSYNELSIHFGEDKTKSTLFGTKRKLRKPGKVNIVYQGIDINQNSQVTYQVVINLTKVRYIITLYS